MPWRTVYKNIILPLEINGKKDRSKKTEVENLIKEFGLEGFENFYPGEISGGMKQRAGILRTFLMESDIMLLDEPFGALDAITRINMQEWLLKVLVEHKKQGVCPVRQTCPCYKNFGYRVSPTKGQRSAFFSKISGIQRCSFESPSLKSFI